MGATSERTVYAHKRSDCQFLSESLGAEAELREKLKYYEDLKNSRGLLVQGAKLGDTV